METTTIDKLFLELSQFTKAKTSREIELEYNYNELIMAVQRKHHGETRHQTALMYIQATEILNNPTVYENLDINGVELWKKI